MNLRYAPIDQWPGKLRTDSQRKPSDFKASWRDTLDLLDREAWSLGCENVTIRLALPSSAIRRDGALADNRRPPEHPGAMVVLDTAAHGVLTYHTDVFARRGYRDEVASWQHNVRAIALGLEALRKVDRYGIADAGEQYAGWKAIGSGIALGQGEQMTVEEAAALLAAASDTFTADDLLSELDCVDRPWINNCYRMGTKQLHPDNGGDPAAFRKLTEARDLLIGHRG